MTDHDLIREGRQFGGEWGRVLADALEAAVARADQLEKALRDVRQVFPLGVCSECSGFEHEVGEANRIIDDALAGGETGDGRSPRERHEQFRRENAAWNEKVEKSLSDLAALAGVPEPPLTDADYKRAANDMPEKLAEPATEDAYPSATAKPAPFIGPIFDADDIAEIGLETCLRTHERLVASSVSAEPATEEKTGTSSRPDGGSGVSSQGERSSSGDTDEPAGLDALLREADVIVGPLRIDREPRELTGDGAPRLAIKSNIFTLFTIGDYYDGGSDGLMARLELVCLAVNDLAASSVSAGAGQVPADTIEQARRAIERFVLCSDTRLRDGMSPDQWVAYQGLLTALAALRRP